MNSNALLSNVTESKVSVASIVSETQPLYNDWAYYLEIGIAVVGCPGVIFNVATILTLYRLDKDQPSTSLMSWLAMYDLLVCLNSGVRTGLLRKIGITFQQLNNFSCKLVNFLVYFQNFGTGFSISVLTIERLLAVKWALFHHRHRSTALANKVSVGVFMASALLASPITYFYKHHQNLGWYLDCAVPRDRFAILQQYAVLTHWMFRFTIPMLVLVVCNSVIVYCIRARRAEKEEKAKKLASALGNQQAPQKPAAADATKSSATHMLIGISVVFVICLGLESLTVAYVVVSPAQVRMTMIRLLFALMNLCRVINATANFSLYMYANPKFRQCFFNLITWTNHK